MNPLGLTLWGVTGALSSQPGRQSSLGNLLVPAVCIGEELLQECVSQSPLSSNPMQVGFPPSPVRINISNSNTNPNVSPPGVSEIPSQPSGSPKSWCAVVAKNTGKASRSLSYHPPSVEDRIVTVKPPIEMLQRGNQIWSSSLVGYFLYSSLPFKVVESALLGGFGVTWGFQKFFGIVKATTFLN